MHNDQNFCVFSLSDAHQSWPVTPVSPETFSFLYLLCSIMNLKMTLLFFFQQLLLTSRARTWRRSGKAACLGWEPDQYEYGLEQKVNGSCVVKLMAVLCSCVCRCLSLWASLRLLAPSCSSWCWWSISVGNTPSSASIVSLSDFYTRCSEVWNIRLRPQQHVLMGFIPQTPTSTRLHFK